MKSYFAFQWHITDECDQRCKHCYIFSENACKKLDAMTWEQMQKTLENCLEFCRAYGRLPYFYITGGDPILHPDFWRLLERLHELWIPFTILGNPFHLDDEVCRRLKALGCEKYQLSLDGMEKTHDWFRKPGSFALTLEKIGCINRAGIRSVIMTTVSGTNIDEVPDIADAVVQAGANVFAFARYCPTSEEKDVGIEPLRYRKLLEDCDRKFRAYEAAGCETYFNKKDHLWTLYAYETGAFRLPEELPPDDPAHGRGLRLPPRAEQPGGQCVRRPPGGPVDRADGGLPRLQPVLQVRKVRIAGLLPGMSGGGQRAGRRLLRAGPAVLEGG